MKKFKKKLSHYQQGLMILILLWILISLPIIMIHLYNQDNNKNNIVKAAEENNIEVLEHGKLEYCNYTIIHDKEYDKEYIVIKAANNSISIIERNKDGDR